MKIFARRATDKYAVRNLKLFLSTKYLMDIELNDLNNTLTLEFQVDDREISIYGIELESDDMLDFEYWTDKRIKDAVNNTDDSNFEVKIYPELLIEEIHNFLTRYDGIKNVLSNVLAEINVVYPDYDLMEIQKIIDEENIHFTVSQIGIDGTIDYIIYVDMKLDIVELYEFDDGSVDADVKILDVSVEKR